MSEGCENPPYRGATPPGTPVFDLEGTPNFRLSNRVLLDGAQVGSSVETYRVLLVGAVSPIPRCWELSFREVAIEVCEIKH